MTDAHQVSARAVLLDIEGTTSSVRFVYDVMFPFARRHLAAYLDEAWGDPSLADACDQMACDAGHESLSAWEQATGAEGKRLVRDEAARLMDADAKATGLKQLQGLIWRSGFETGEMVAHVYPDVPPALTAWNATGVDVRVYSSGSVAAQRLFFGHTEAGDLLSCFSGHYDTTSGPKREAESYRRIAEDWGPDPPDILFVSDVVAELDAAQAAGMHTALSLRPENEPQGGGHAHPTVETFDHLRVTAP